ncbi:hypothetical protein JW948_08140 [bacterium]|nr:hypothetical protein [bacterium]
MFLILLFSSCTINRLNNEKTVIHLHPADQDLPLCISVTRGAEWSHKFTPGPFVIHIYPQIVFWCEDSLGHFVKTLYITGADGKYGKNTTKARLDDDFFRICFPGWTSRLISAGGHLPSRENPYTDALTSATPQSSFDLFTTLGPAGFPCKIYAEINKSMDYNQAFTEEKTGWVGQPSLIYYTEIPEYLPDKPFILLPIGQGDVQGGLQGNLDGFDTALEMVRDIQAVIQ